MEHRHGVYSRVRLYLTSYKIIQNILSMVHGSTQQLIELERYLRGENIYNHIENYHDDFQCGIFVQVCQLSEDSCIYSRH